MKIAKKENLAVIISFACLMFILVIGGASAETVYTGYIDYYDADFSTETIHPLDYPYGSLYLPYGSSYLPEGSGEITVEFKSYLGTGPVTLEVSSDAFVGDTSTTENINAEDVPYLFKLAYNVKTDIDGRYIVRLEARNQFGDILDVESIRIQVWSGDHIDAADDLFLLRNRLSTGYGYMFPFGQAFDSPQGRTDFNAAVDEFNLALVAYHNEQWNEVEQRCSYASGFLDSAEGAEVGWSQLSIGNPISYVTLMVVAVLAIVYLIVAIWRKIRPISKT